MEISPLAFDRLVDSALGGYRLPQVAPAASAKWVSEKSWETARTAGGRLCRRHRTLLGWLAVGVRHELVSKNLQVPRQRDADLDIPANSFQQCSVGLNISAIGDGMKLKESLLLAGCDAHG